MATRLNEDLLRQMIATSGQNPVAAPNQAVPVQAAGAGLDLASTILARQQAQEDRERQLREKIEAAKLEAAQRTREQGVRDVFGKGRKVAEIGGKPVFASETKALAKTPQDKEQAIAAAYPKETALDYLKNQQLETSETGKLQRALLRSQIDSNKPVRGQNVGSTTSGLAVSYDPIARQYVIPTGEPFDPAVHGQLVQKTAQPLGGEETKDIRNTFNSYTKLKQLKDEFQPNAVGFVQGRLVDISRATGIDLVPGMQINAEFRSKLAGAINDYIKAVTGAQMSEPEARRIMQALPSQYRSAEDFIPSINAAIDAAEQRLKNDLMVFRATNRAYVDPLIQELGIELPAKPGAAPAAGNPGKKSSFRVISVRPSAGGQ